MKKYLYLLLISVLSGCTSTPLSTPRYLEAKQNLPSIETGKERLILFRPPEGTKMSKAPAYIYVDSKEIVSLFYGAFVYADVSSGNHKISVKALGTSSCDLNINSSSGEERYFEIVPRDSFNPAWAMLGLVGGAVIYASSAVESAGKECGGEFAVQQVEKNYAISKLKDIRINEY